ncbi:MAG: carboxypeptidase regulatory-like domain-containing protein, partial [Deltaproteobacteria bacterium]|nr:carboxypeptidase regulatory-like domain-containing protein [Deltaproteobacteria bacterium]
MNTPLHQGNNCSYSLYYISIHLFINQNLYIMRNVTKTLRMFIAVLIAAVAFASTVSAQTILMTQSFDAGSGFTPPAGWTIQPVSGSTNAIQFVTSGTWPTVAPYHGTKLVEFLSFNYSNSVQRLAMTTPISTVGAVNIGIDFAWYEDPGYSGSNDRVDVQWSTNGTTWNTAGTFSRYNAVAGWKIKNVSLPAGAQEQPTFYIAFMFTSAWGNNCHLDLAHVTGFIPPPPIVITLGTSTVTQSHPYNTYWHDSRTQMLYLASEITAAGGSSGEISWIAYYVTSYATQTMNGFKIRMLNTNLTSLSGFYLGDMTTCYDGTYAVPGTGWQQVTLQDPFLWDGTSNLLVDVCFDNSSYTSATFVRCSYYYPYRCLHYYTDGAAGCSFTSSYARTYRPNMQFLLTPMVGNLIGTVTNCYNGAPLAGATVTAGPYSTTTNASGGYAFIFIPIGNYTVQCTAPGFLPQTKTATLYNLQTTVVDFCMNPIPAYCTGVVYNNDTGEPIVGAKVAAGGCQTYSVSGGQYTLNIYPVGTFNVTASKAGFDPFTGGPFTFQQGV